MCEVSFQSNAVLAPNDVINFMTTQENERCGGQCVKKLGLNGSRRIYVLNIKFEYKEHTETEQSFEPEPQSAL